MRIFDVYRHRILTRRLGRLLCLLANVLIFERLNMARIDLNSMTLWITAAAVQHPHTLVQEIMNRMAVTRQTAHKLIKKLMAVNWLINEGSPRRPHFKPGLLRQVVRRYELAGLTEDRPWSQDFAPFFTLPAQVQRMAQHAFCELVNNAIDHSEGSCVTISLRQTPNQVQLLVSDDGRGLFDKISQVFSIGDPHAAMLELSKGKLTGQPERHTGRGLFFTSKLADVFDLHANDVAFQHREWNRAGWLPGRPLKHHGTSVYFSICLDTQRTLDSILQSFSLNGSGYGFERTVVPLQLVTNGQIGLESRAQARRVANRLSQFQRAEVDFAGIPYVGHSFVDELFRVLTLQHAKTEIIPINMCPAVAAMVNSVREPQAV